MITETERYFPALLAVLKEDPRYNSAAWLIRYHMMSMVEIYKGLL